MSQQKLTCTLMCKARVSFCEGMGIVQPTKAVVIIPFHNRLDFVILNAEDDQFQLRNLFLNNKSYILQSVVVLV